MNPRQQPNQRPRPAGSGPESTTRFATWSVVFGTWVWFPDSRQTGPAIEQRRRYGANGKMARVGNTTWPVRDRQRSPAASKGGL